jgi:hypothetical protein
VAFPKQDTTIYVPVKDRTVGLQHRLLSKKGKCMKNCIVHCKSEEQMPLMVIFIGEGNWRTPQKTTDILYHIVLYCVHLAVEQASS